MIDRKHHSNVPGVSDHSVDEVCRLLQQNRGGSQRGIYSVCSANRLVLEAAFAQALHDQSPLLIEATCNQVNQEGGYTGMTPAQFRDYVLSIADELGFRREMLILGGDHLGPNPWRSGPAAEAMEKASIMVSAYAEAGFSKVHLDASMPCGDDPRPLGAQEIAKRAAHLCAVAEAASSHSSVPPVYIIGTEVPTPGGAQQEMEIEVTSTVSLQETLDVHREAFASEHLDSAWQRVIGVVVQPGVEFNDMAVADYVPEKATALVQFVLQQERIVFEAHSTDYQSASSLRQLVRDHFGILKVGPELTFVMREAIFGLGRIEEEWIPASRRSNIRDVMEHLMVEHPENWKPYYRGDEDSLRVARAFSFSDRIRYYWPNGAVSHSLDALLHNLTARPAPLPLIAQYLPRQAEAIRAGELRNGPDDIIRHHIRRSLARYADACGLLAHEP